MVPEYIRAVDRLMTDLRPDNVGEAIAIAGLPDMVRGYEHLKMERAAAYRAELAARVFSFTG
jgi:indolepyruvate ferredoxin oxidoreductase